MQQNLGGLGDGDLELYWTIPVIDPVNGVGSFKLRSEMIGSGAGRV